MSTDNDWFESMDTQSVPTEEGTLHDNYSDFYLYDMDWWWRVYRPGDKEVMDFKERWHALSYIHKVMEIEGYSMANYPHLTPNWNGNEHECNNCAAVIVLEHMRVEPDGIIYYGICNQCLEYHQIHLALPDDDHTEGDEWQE